MRAPKELDTREGYPYKTVTGLGISRSATVGASLAGAQKLDIRKGYPYKNRHGFRHQSFCDSRGTPCGCPKIGYPQGVSLQKPSWV
ncbi:hypothetical protein JCM15764A_06880 [Geotalea toluenoxydans]